MRKEIKEMTRLAFGMFIFFSCCPALFFAGCTMSTAQTQAAVQAVDMVGKTIEEVVKIYGQPLSVIPFAARGSETENAKIVRYEGMTLIVRDGVVISQRKTDGTETGKGN